MITTLDNRPNSEIVFELNKLLNKRVTLYCWGSLNDVTGVLTAASVISAEVSIRIGDSYQRVRLADVVGVEAL